MPTTIHLPLLDSIRIASPCDARWEDMTGDARRRHCAQCDLDVHNISNMTRDEAEHLLAKLSEGRICARFYRRSDGTILTRDCPNGLAAARRLLLRTTSRLAAAIGLAILASAAAKAAQDKSWGNYGWSLRLSNAKPVRWLSDHLHAQAISRSALGSAMGRVAGPPPPPGPPPPTQGAFGSPYGPHEWEYQR